MATPELLLFTGDTLREVMNPPAPDYPPILVSARRSGLVRLAAQVNYGTQDVDAVAHASQWLDSHADRPSTWLLDFVMDVVDADVLVEKSPDTTSTPQNLSRCISYRADAAYVVLLRDPWAVVDSMWRHWTRLMGGLDPAAVVRRCAVACYTSARTLATCMPEADRSDAWLTVRSEDLVWEPERILSTVVRHLGLDWSEQERMNVMHPELWEFASTGPTKNLSGGDPTFLANPQFTPMRDDIDHRARVLPRLADEPRAVAALDSLAHSLGYAR